MICQDVEASAQTDRDRDARQQLALAAWSEFREEWNGRSLRGHQQLVVELDLEDSRIVFRTRLRMELLVILCDREVYLEGGRTYCHPGDDTGPPITTLDHLREYVGERLMAIPKNADLSPRVVRQRVRQAKHSLTSHSHQAMRG